VAATSQRGVERLAIAGQPREILKNAALPWPASTSDQKRVPCTLQPRPSLRSTCSPDRSTAQSRMRPMHGCANTTRPLRRRQRRLGHRTPCRRQGGLEGHRPLLERGRRPARFGCLPMMIDMDAPDHVRRRRLVSAGFTPRRVRALEDTVTAVCDEIIDRVCTSGGCDFVADIAAPLPDDRHRQPLGCGGRGPRRPPRLVRRSLAWPRHRGPRPRRGDAQGIRRLQPPTCGR